MKPFRGDKTLGLAIRQVLLLLKEIQNSKHVHVLPSECMTKCLLWFPLGRLAGVACWEIGRKAEKEHAVHTTLSANVENLQHDPS